jgi:DNA-binding PadR family transcriptional regulator
MYRIDTSATLIGVLELAILGLLKEQALHGYELKKRLADTLGARSGVSYGSLYPALGRLEAAGAVKAVEPAGTVSIPQTGSLGGELAAFRARRAGSRGSRGKKVYGITDRGEQLFAELLTAESTSAEDERLFNLRLAFARYLPPGARLGLLERRRAHLLERLSRLSTRVRTGRDRLDGYAHSLLEHDRETTEHDLSWIDRLIATERSGGQPGPPEGDAVGEAAIPFPLPSLSPASLSPAASSPASPRLPAVPSSSAVPRSTAGMSTMGSTYRPSLSGLRPPTSEENSTV